MLRNIFFWALTSMLTFNTSSKGPDTHLITNFLASNYPSASVQQSTLDQRAQEEPDPHRPPCVTADCRKIEKFSKEHYCGESPFGNGPENGCDYKEPVRTGAKLAVSFHCEWNDDTAKSTCHQIGKPSSQQRQLLLRELRQLGLPSGRDQEVTYMVVESLSGWTLMAADYGHVDGPDLYVCEIVVALDQSGKPYVLRSLRLQKTDSDVPEVTQWSPLDIADVDGDGKFEFVLRGDAYENHWLEVIQIEGGYTKTIFSGLGYYL